MKWIDKYAEGTFGLFAGNSIANFQPIDFFHFFPLWYDLWIKQIAKIIEKLNLQNKSYTDISDLLPVPSSMRAILVKLIVSYQALEKKDIKSSKIVADFFARMLMEACPNDPFSKTSNPFHTNEKAQMIVNDIKWQEANPGLGRIIGRLVTSAGSLVHGLYNDVVTDFGWDTYGPYSVSLGDDKYTFLIRHFPDMAPEDLWAKEYLASAKEIYIYACYQNIEWQIIGVGCHTINTTGSPVESMKKFAVSADGKFLSIEEIQNLIEEFSNKAEAIYKKIRNMTFEELKQKVMLQECYQLKKLCHATGIDWKPTKEMEERINGKELLRGIIDQETMMTDLNEYRKIFGIDKFSKEVLQEA